MNFEEKIEALTKEIDAIKARQEKLAKAYAKAYASTKDFLEHCAAYGIDLVSIGTYTDRIKACKDYPFECDGSVFADRRENGWPAIWSVVKDLDISIGCGNGGQHQANTTHLIDGVYECRSGKWQKIQ